MVKSGVATEVVYDPSSSYTRSSRSGAYATERQNFLGKKMVKSGVATEVVYDPSSSYTRSSRSGAYATERQNFLSGNLSDMYRKPVSRDPDDHSESENEDMSLAKLLKDVEFLGASNMSWKDRKKLENQKVVNLGGKALKKHRTPLSIAIPAMKNQKKREQKKLEEDSILGRFIKKGAKNNNKVHKRKPEDRVLKASEGHFSKGVLDVKRLLAPLPSKSDDTSHQMGKGKKTGKGKGKKGKRKGGRKGGRKGR